MIRKLRLRCASTLALATRGKVWSAPSIQSPPDPIGPGQRRFSHSGKPVSLPPAEKVRTRGTKR